MTRTTGIPAEIRVSAVMLAIAGPLFLVVRLLRGFVDGQAGVLLLPIVLAVVEVLIAGALLSGVRGVRPVAVGVAAIAALLHLVVLLSAGPWWTVAASGVLAAAHIYAVVLLNTGPARGIRGGRS